MERNVPATADKLKETLETIIDLTDSRAIRWLVGGSTGLLLHGVGLNALPNDLDIYADGDDARQLHRLLEPYALDEQQESDAGIYSSLLSHYSVNGLQVELVGSFQVKAMNSVYKVEARYLAERWAKAMLLDAGRKLWVMPQTHELIFNVMRGRADRYTAIAAHCLALNWPEHRSALYDLVGRNRISKELRRQLAGLLKAEGG